MSNKGVSASNSQPELPQRIILKRGGLYIECPAGAIPPSDFKLIINRLLLWSIAERVFLWISFLSTLQVFSVYFILAMVSLSVPFITVVRWLKRFVERRQPPPS